MTERVGQAEVEHLHLAVSDIVNETGEKELELSGLLRTVLEQSTFLEVLPRGRLIDALARPPADGPLQLDEPTAQAAARAVSARYLLLARLLRLGETYLLEVRAIDPASGTSRFSFKEQVLGKNSLSAMVDTVAERARLLLGENPESIRSSTIPSGMVTGSLEAWRAYSSGITCFELGSFSGSFEPCLASMEKATALDPGFALAHLQVAVFRFFAGRPLALQQEAVREAQRHAIRMPPHDRGRLDGWAAYLQGRDEEAKRLLREAARASPGDKLAWYLAGEVPYHRDEFPEALPLFERAYQLDPNLFDAAQHLILLKGVAGDFEGVRAMARELSAEGKGGAALAAACYARLWVDPASAVETCQRARRGAASETIDGALAIALHHVGRRDELPALLKAMEERWKNGPHGFAWYMRLWLMGQEGRWTEVERMAVAEGDPDDPWFHVEHAELLAGAGDPGGVSKAGMRVLEINRLMASSIAVHLAYLGDHQRAAAMEHYLPAGSPRVEAYRALVRWRSGDLPGAIEDLRTLAAKAPLSADPAIPPPLYLLGEALSEAGRDAEAVDALRRFSRLPLTYPSWCLPRSRWFMARSMERLGDHDGARQALSPLLALWTQASTEQPYLQEARALGARLGLH